MTSYLKTLWTYLESRDKIDRAKVMELLHDVEQEAATKIDEQSKRAEHAEAALESEQENHRAIVSTMNRVAAERDELRRAIMRLPQPPDEQGDGPDERVTNALNEIEWQINLKLAAYSTGNIALKELDNMRTERDAARAEVERLRAFVAAYDAWATDEQEVYGFTFDAMIDARAALDAKEQTSTQ